MTRECHVRFCERLGAKLPWSTYLFGSIGRGGLIPIAVRVCEGQSNRVVFGNGRYLSANSNLGLIDPPPNPSGDSMGWRIIHHLRPRETADGGQYSVAYARSIAGDSALLTMALTIPGHLAYRTGLLGLNVAWVVTTGMALYAISIRRIEQHRDWMLRSYTVTFAFIAFRLGEQVSRN